MKVLQIHNTYKHFGGEDVIVNMEYSLLKNNNINVSQLLFDNNKLNPLNFFYNRNSYKIVKEQILESKPDIIHVHNLFYEASPSVLQCAKDYNVPVVLTLHNYRLICPNGLLLRDEKPCFKCVNQAIPISAIKYKCFQQSRSKTFVLSLFLAYHNQKGNWNNLVDKFIVLTPFAKQIIIKSALQIDQNKISIKPNSVDDFGLDVDKKRKDYLFIGRLSNEKGIQIAIDGFNLLNNVNLHVIGSGPLEDQLKKQANKNIIFHGSKDKSFIKNKLSESKALIFPSICYEGLPNTLLEAFSSGTPVIYSNIENINSIIKNNKTGLAFKTGDCVSLKETVLNFEKTGTPKFNTNAREKYHSNYTHNKNIISLLKIYNEAIETNEKNRYIKLTDK